MKNTIKRWAVRLAVLVGAVAAMAPGGGKRVPH